MTDKPMDRDMRDIWKRIKAERTPRDIARINEIHELHKAMDAVDKFLMHPTDEMIEAGMKQLALGANSPDRTIRMFNAMINAIPYRKTDT